MPTIEFQTIKGSRASAVIDVPKTLRVLADNEKPAKGWGCFRVMTAQDGDKRVVWDARDLDQIEEAKEMFDQLVQEGLVPYKVGIDGKATADVMDEFDPDAEEVIFLPVAAAVAGG